MVAVLDMQDDASVIIFTHLSGNESEKIRVFRAESHGCCAPADSAGSPFRCASHLDTADVPGKLTQMRRDGPFLHSRGILGDQRASVDLRLSAEDMRRKNDLISVREAANGDRPVASCQGRSIGHRDSDGEESRQHNALRTDSVRTSGSGVSIETTWSTGCSSSARPLYFKPAEFFVPCGGIDRSQGVSQLECGIALLAGRLPAAQPLVSEVSLLTRPNPGAHMVAHRSTLTMPRSVIRLAICSRRVAAASLGSIPARR